MKLADGRHRGNEPRRTANCSGGAPPCVAPPLRAPIGCHPHPWASGPDCVQTPFLRATRNLRRIQAAYRVLRPWSPGLHLPNGRGRVELYGHKPPVVPIQSPLWTFLGSSGPSPCAGFVPGRGTGRIPVQVSRSDALPWPSPQVLLRRPSLVARALRLRSRASRSRGDGAHICRASRWVELRPPASCRLRRAGWSGEGPAVGSARITTGNMRSGSGDCAPSRGKGSRVGERAGEPLSPERRNGLLHQGPCPHSTARDWPVEPPALQYCAHPARMRMQALRCSRAGP